MTYKVHGFLDNKKQFDRLLNHLPRTGDTVRLSDDIYAIVTEVVWCLDEQHPMSQATRVNLRMEPLVGVKA